MTPSSEPEGNGKGSSGRAWVLHPAPPRQRRGGSEDNSRTGETRLDEAVSLARAINLSVDVAEVVPLRKARPATLLGPGQVEKLATRLAASSRPDVIVVDAALGPVQHRNLETALRAKVLDRTGLILEIFGARARSREGRLQVELAALTYQRSRLVRSWTHLERQRGGLGFVGGPGESQLEADRRMIDQRITRLRRALTGVSRTRELHRAARRRVPYPVVALVGYTNAGKSTLFNRLTGADVDSRDQLFATLDPTMRAMRLGSGLRVILSDTVGFVSELPTDLIAAFRATLEEVVEADLVLNVGDVSHPEFRAQSKDVAKVLRDLGIDPGDGHRVVDILNKVDLLDAQERRAVMTRSARASGQLAVSALDGSGIESLCGLIDARLGEGREVLDLDIDLSDGAALSWLYRYGHVLDRRDDGRVARLRVRLEPVDAHRFDRQFGRAAAE